MSNPDCFIAPRYLPQIITPRHSSTNHLRPQPSTLTVSNRPQFSDASLRVNPNRLQTLPSSNVHPIIPHSSYLPRPVIFSPNFPRLVPFSSNISRPASFSPNNVRFTPVSSTVAALPVTIPANVSLYTPIASINSRSTPTAPHSTPTAPYSTPTAPYSTPTAPHSTPTAPHSTPTAPHSTPTCSADLTWFNGKKYTKVYSGNVVNLVPVVEAEKAVEKISAVGTGIPRIQPYPLAPGPVAVSTALQPRPRSKDILQKTHSGEVARKRGRSTCDEFAERPFKMQKHRHRLAVQNSNATAVECRTTAAVKPVLPTLAATDGLGLRRVPQPRIFYSRDSPEHTPADFPATGLATNCGPISSTNLGVRSPYPMTTTMTTTTSNPIPRGTPRFVPTVTPIADAIHSANALTEYTTDAAVDNPYSYPIDTRTHAPTASLPGGGDVMDPERVVLTPPRYSNVMTYNCSDTDTRLVAEPITRHPTGETPTNPTRISSLPEYSQPRSGPYPGPHPGPHPGLHPGPHPVSYCSSYLPSQPLRFRYPSFENSSPIYSASQLKTDASPPLPTNVQPLPTNLAPLPTNLAPLPTTHLLPYASDTIQALAGRLSSGHLAVDEPAHVSLGEVGNAVSVNLAPRKCYFNLYTSFHSPLLPLPVRLYPPLRHDFANLYKT